ncbi:MAG: YifB family Mg chelatase-like AAA ATPase [Candidatus Firestonebacteria bacterium]
MLAKVYSSAVIGIDAYTVEVEVDLANGMPYFFIVGLPDTAVKESRDRVKSAIKNSEFEFPIKKITVNLAPADIKKEGVAFDLPIAIGILFATGQITNNLEKYIIVGELSLDGSLRPVRGVLSMAMSARANGKEGIILPYDNCKEAGVVEGINVYPVRTLSQAVKFINNEIKIEPYVHNVKDVFVEDSKYDTDFSEVKGQENVKRALEIAAAGGHNIVMIGTPGSGKSMLAKRLPSILPELSVEEAIEISRIHSIAGLIPSKKGLIGIRPFRSPHHTISDVALVGGGSVPKPGEVSLAHNGVLFLDELPEFNKNVLEVLRQPLEDGMVVISRAIKSVAFPSQFMFVAALNPCPCGYFGDQNKNCICTTTQIQKYMGKLSGPLLDRIDIHIEVPAVKYGQLADETPAENSEVIRGRVNKARKIQKARFANKKIHCNARMQNKDIKKHCKINDESNNLLRIAIEQLGLSARAYTRILKVARTIADLENQENIETTHISEAIQYRSLDRQL